MAEYIFGGNTGETPESIRIKREIAAQIMGNAPAPRTIGQGLNALGQGIAANVMNRRADNAERAGREGADSLFNGLVSGITNGAPITGNTGSVQPPPADPGVSGLDPNNPVYSGFMGTVQKAGVTNPYALAAIASTGHAESRFDPNNANRTWSDPSASGKPGTAGGVMSWRGGRLNNLYQFAAQRGEKPGNISPQTQAEFFLSEDPSLIQSLQQAKSASEAQNLMNNAWRFANYDKPGGEAARRTTFAQGLVPSFQGDQAALPPNAQPTSGQGQQQPMGGGNLQQLMQAAANPWLNEGQRAIINSMIEQQMQAQDPMRQLQMRKLQQQVDNPGSDENFYGNPVAVQNQDGSIAYGQIGNRGTFKPIQLGEGQSFAPPTRTIDAGTETLMVDQAGNVISRQPKNSFQPAFDAASGRAQGDAAGGAIAAAPGDFQAGQNALDLIKSIREDPNREWGTGKTAVFNAIPGTTGFDFNEKVKQAKSGAFLTAIQQMRGLGALSNAEGEAATAAITRMNTSMTEEGFLAALDDYEKIVKQGVERARQKLPAGSAPSAGQSTSGNDLKSKYGLE